MKGAFLVKLCERDITAEPVVIAVISTWEAVSLLSGRLPTVTSRVLLLPRPVRGLLVAGVTLWMLRHFEVR
jgi:hypothetical protein